MLPIATQTGLDRRRPVRFAMSDASDEGQWKAIKQPGLLEGEWEPEEKTGVEPIDTLKK